MRRIPEPLASDPIIAAALAACEIDPRKLPLDGQEDESEFELHATQWLPAILVRTDGQASISWYNPQHMIRYALDGDGLPGIVTVEKLMLPELAVDGFGGRTLSEVISFPGAERMRILVAVNSSPFPGEITDLRMTVEAITETVPC